MDDLFECICNFGDNHFWIRCFLKNVVFLLKRISAHPMLYDANHAQFINDAAKNEIWAGITYDYNAQFTLSDSSDGECEESCLLKLTQKSAQYHLKRIIKSMRLSQEVERSNQPASTQNTKHVPRSVAHYECQMIDFLHRLEFVLEFIVANPSLYDRKSEYYSNEHIKLKIWNEICTVFYEKLQGNDFELGDMDSNFEIKYTKKKIERLLQRLASPLCISHKSMANESKRFNIGPNMNSDTDGDDSDGAHLSDRNFFGSKRPVTINIAPSKTGSQTVNIILTDGSVPKEGKETNATESKLRRHRKRLQEHLANIDRSSAQMKRPRSECQESEFGESECRSVQSDRSYKFSHDADRDRNPDTLKRKNLNNEDDRERKFSPEFESKEEVKKRKKILPPIESNHPIHESRANHEAHSNRIKSVIQKKEDKLSIRKK